MMDSKKKARIKRKEDINQYLRGRFESVQINGTECFILPAGTIIHLESMGDSYNAIVVGYANNMKEAKNNMFEDGDLFYMDEMSREEMLEAVIREINQEIEEDG